MPTPNTVCIVLDSSHFGGIESHVFQLASGLKNRSIPVSIVFLQDYSCNSGVHPLQKQLDHKQIKFSVLDGRYQSIKSYLQNERPLICHTHGYKAGIYTRFACLRMNIPCITTYHAGESCKGKVGLYDFIDRSTAVFNSYNTAVSNQIASKVYAPCTQMNNFIDTQKLEISHGSKIGFVGRLSEEKDPEKFVALASNFPSEDFCVYGDGPMRSKIKGSSGKNCKIFGHVNMDEHWKDLKVLIICSKYEGLPLCLLEAMARGIIVISYNLGQIASVIQNNKNGFITNERDFNSLKLTLENVLTISDDKSHSLRENAIKTIQKHFSTNAVLPKYISLYEKHIGSILNSHNNSNIIVADPEKTSQKPLKILFVHYGENWLRGSEYCLINLVCSLKNQGIQPLVWCNSEILYQELKIKKISVKKTYFTILLGWEKPRFNISNSQRLISTAKKIIRKNNIDVIHTNGGAPNQWMLIAARITSTPIVTQLHAPYQLRDRISLSLRDPDIVIGVSKAVINPFISKTQKSNKKLTRQNLENTHQQQEKYKVIHNGIDLSPYKDNKNTLKNSINIRETLNIKQDAYVIISIGSLIHRKGFDILIKSIQILREQSVKAELIIVGDGCEHKNLKALSEELNVSECVHFLGERNDIPKLLRSNVDIFASGARDEAFGLVLAEAGAAGLACVAPNTGGIPELVVNRKSGILVEPSSHTETAKALDALFKSKKTRIEMGEYAKSHVFKRFSLDKNTQEFISTYKNVKKKNSKVTLGSKVYAYLSPVFSLIEFTFTRKC